MKRLALAAAATLLLFPVPGAFAKGALQIQRPVNNSTCEILTYGTDGDDVLDDSTTVCNATIYGFKGNDVLIGGNQDDTLVGGKGQDVMTGNGGNNIFVFQKASDSKITTTPDEITDFKAASDILDVTGVCTNAAVTCSFIGNNFFDGTPGEIAYDVGQVYYCDPITHQCGDRYITFVSIDLDGDEAADFGITLDGQLTLTSSNFAF